MFKGQRLKQSKIKISFSEGTSSPPCGPACSQAYKYSKILGAEYWLLPTSPQLLRLQCLFKVLAMVRRDDLGF